MYASNPNKYLIENTPVVIKEITREIARPKPACEIIYQDVDEIEHSDTKDAIRSIRPVVLPHKAVSNRNIDRMFK